jgi:hypothetical protein
MRKPSSTTASDELTGADSGFHERLNFLNASHMVVIAGSALVMSKELRCQTANSRLQIPE